MEAAEMERDGLVLGMSDEVYHGGPEFSSSAAKEILKSAAHYKHTYIDGNKVTKKAWDLGTGVHTKVLGVGSPAVAYPEKVLAANGAASTNDARAWAAEQRAAGCIPVKQAELDKINAMTESVLANELARALIEQPGHPEASMFATDPETGLRLRCRFDYLPDDRRAAVDLKTTRDASPRGFKKLAYDLRYHVSRAHYRHTAKLVGEPVDEMVFVAVENEAPHLVVVYQLEQKFAEMGEDDAEIARRRLARCLETDTWPGYPPGLQMLSAPVYGEYEHIDAMNEELERA
ncbi:PD-(D/E)XK nuclease-like domain-containing protein [Leucobacter allii]|uniref:PD-(D/E)XK nuclease-like domain-containing protein n=1 Tax=Leucobacter allii TaxID=2932247 RepID=UPI001FD09E41|nr:PD-(D/E)XK nuclease-like domain-containing protein [Leucobacter allii]UOR02017.1 PD-(D/E)XK nuclease-like domain-containing protein [Leucobacter allii]